MYEWVEFRHFRYLLSILERQGFRAASEELHTSQPNLSRHARQFEENANVHLYRKTRNGRIRLTESGIAFLTLARLLLETRDEVMETLIAIERAHVQALRIGTFSMVDPRLFQELCQLHRTLVPSCTLRTLHGDADYLQREVLAGAIDVALVTAPVTHPDLRVETIVEDPLVACLRRDHPLAKKPSLHSSDLDQQLSVFLHPDRHPAGHSQLLRTIAAVGIRVDPLAQASHPSEMQALVLDNFGMALLPSRTQLLPELKALPISDVEWSVDTVAIYHRRLYPKTVPIVLKQLRHLVSKQSQAEAPGLAHALATKALTGKKKPPHSATNLPSQLRLLPDTEAM